MEIAILRQMVFILNWALDGSTAEWDINAKKSVMGIHHYVLLTHWSIGDVVVVLNVWFSNW